MMENKTGRQSNIELLRIIAMVMIVAYHLSCHGIMHYQTDEQFIVWSTGSFANKMFSAFLFPGGEIGVAIFFIIAGFFSINKKKRSTLKVVVETSFME